MSSPNTVIQVENLSKRFVVRKDKSLKERLVNFTRSQQYKEDFWALRDVSLDIESGTTVGLIGPNGSGKSTLLKAIGGIIEPTTGTVRVKGRMAALLELGAGFHPDLTGRENVYLNAALLGLTEKETDKVFDAIVDFSGIADFIDTQVKFYSNGMYVRLAFAVAVHVDPDLLLVDEVLAVGDEPFRRKCLDQIRAFQAEGRTIIMVSHDFTAVSEFCNRGIVLRAGQVQYDGDTDVAIQKLRGIFDENRRLTASASDGDQTIESVRVITAAGTAAATVRPGDDLAVEVAVSTATVLPEWVVGLTITTPFGQDVLTTSTKAIGGRKPAALRGSTVVRFTLPDLRLGTGSYLVGATFGVPGNEGLVRITNAARLEATGLPGGSGLVAVKPSYSRS